MTEALAGGKTRPGDIDGTLAAIAETTWTPTWTGLSKGNGTESDNFYVVHGRFVIAHYVLTAGSTTSYSAISSFTLPVEAAAATQEAVLGSWAFRDDSLTDIYAGSVTLLTSTTARLAGAWSGTLPVDFVGQGGNRPVSIATNDKVCVQLAYVKA
jgi:hypothetical protein